MKRFLDSRLKMRHLRVLDAVDRLGSLTKAAAALGLSQPALTKTLNDVEAILDVRLFERGLTGASSNALGLMAAESARRVLAELNDLERRLEERSEAGEGVVLAGALPAAATGLMPGAVARLQGQSPGLRVEMSQGQSDELLAALATGDIDLVVGRLSQAGESDRFERRPLYIDTVSVLARADHPVFAAGAFDAAALRRYPLALPPTPAIAGTDVDPFIAALGLHGAEATLSTSLPFIRELLLSTDAITVAPRMMLAGDLSRGAVREIPTQAQGETRVCGVTTLRGRRLPRAARAFVAVLEAYIAELAMQPSAGLSRPEPEVMPPRS